MIDIFLFFVNHILSGDTLALEVRAIFWILVCA